MKWLIGSLILAGPSLFSLAPTIRGQNPSEGGAGAVRVNVTLNKDGSRTAYEFDHPNHKATATTTERDGKLRTKIHYQLDQAGRFASGQVYGPDGELRFKSAYKYDSAGRIEQETQLGKDDQVLNKIVYSYDPTGKQTGYSIFDGGNKLVGRTSAPSPTPSPKPRKK